LGVAITSRLLQDPDHKVYFSFHYSAEQAEQLTATHPNANAVQCDFTDADSVDSLIAKIGDMDLDLLINNAYTGKPVRALFHKLPAEEIRMEFEANILPTIRITQAAIDGFRKKKHGHIITILSNYLDHPPAGTSVYVAGKAYLEQLVYAWAHENAKFNIRSNAISPSFMQTGLTKDTDERIIEQMIGSSEAKRLLRPDEVAAAISDLLQASNTTNAANIILNPGKN